LASGGRTESKPPSTGAPAAAGTGHSACSYVIYKPSLCCGRNWKRCSKPSATTTTSRARTNAEVNGYEVDALWPDEGLIVEVDSREFHLNGRAFEDDRLKDAELVAAGYRVIRVTHRQLKHDPAGVARRIRRALAQGWLR